MCIQVKDIGFAHQPPCCTPAGVAVSLPPVPGVAGPALAGVLARLMRLVQDGPPADGSTKEQVRTGARHVQGHPGLPACQLHTPAPPSGCCWVGARRTHMPPSLRRSSQAAHALQVLRTSLAARRTLAGPIAAGNASCGDRCDPKTACRGVPPGPRETSV